MPKDQRPEPNFAQLVTEDQLPYITVSAHAMRRLVQRLEPRIPGADQVAAAMRPFEKLGSGNRTGQQQGQLRSYRDWMSAHVQPHILDMILCEGFWATRRPRWCQSRTPADGWLQIGGLCLFPIVIGDGPVVLTTCECGKAGGREITWDLALERGYTQMPKPYIHSVPKLLRAPSWITITSRAWRSRRQHHGLLAAFRTERSTALGDTQRENERRESNAANSQHLWLDERDRAARLFRERHLR